MFTKRTVAVAAAGLAAVVFSGAAQAQHGVLIQKSCVSPVCVSEPTDCIINIGHSDFFGDTIQIMEAFDVADSGPAGDNVRIPSIGNLPIISVFGNTTCTPGGSLPCRVGPPGSTLGGLPGDPNPGLVSFHSNQYIVQPDDPLPLPDQANVIVQDMCDDPDTQGCSSLANIVQFTASTIVPDCDDNNACTTDTCDLTLPGCNEDELAACCINTPDCTSPADCDDVNACTEDVCTAQGCCENPPLECDDDNSCTMDTCNPQTGCVFSPDCSSPADCNDGNACTDDVCTAQGCCENPPLECDDDNPCTTDTCNPQTGCVFTPDCSSPADCDDDNACTDDVCTAQGCCENPPLECDDDNPCTDDTCNPQTGCVFSPGCSNNADCNDGDPCTADVCTPQGCCENPAECTSPADCDDGDECTEDLCTADGCCANVPVVCDDDDPCTFDECVDGECQFLPNPDCVLQCRVTGGATREEPGGGNRAHGSGQAGAPDSQHGEWTHHQISGPDGSFIFHAGTSSSPDETEIHIVTCSDPGFCHPARPAPAKQIDFAGVGEFKNMRNPSPLLQSVVVKESLHWFEVHIEDLGEPGGRGGRVQDEPDPAICPPDGSAGSEADCECPDFYRIVIYEGFEPGEAPNMTDVIYTVSGYIRTGNYQIHPALD
jgi:hypothetical protein